MRVRRKNPTKKTDCHEKVQRRKFPAAKPCGRAALPRSCGQDAHHRLPLPPQPRIRGLRPPFPQSGRDMARRRPLQVARDAHQRRRGALLHGRRLGLGEVREVGRDGALHHAQSALPLDAPRTQDRFRRRGAAQPRFGARDLRPLHRSVAAARIFGAGTYAPLQCGGRMHDRRPRRFAGAPYKVPRGGFRVQGAAHVAARQGHGRGEPGGIQSLYRPFGRGGGHRDTLVRDPA